MVNNRIINQVRRADRNREDVCIEHRKEAAYHLFVRSVICAILATLTFVLMFNMKGDIALASLAIIPSIQSLVDYKRHRFQRHIVALHDKWHDDYKNREN